MPSDKKPMKLPFYFLALGFCPSCRSGGYYDTKIITVSSEGKGHLLEQEWFNAEIEFPEAQAWFNEMKKFYFPGGFDGSRQWTEMQWELCPSLEKAQYWANRWAENDVDHNFDLSNMSPKDCRDLGRNIANCKEGW